MKNYILFTILLLTTTMKAITYPSTWGTDRIFLYDFWDQCGKPAALNNWGDVNIPLTTLNGTLGISITHPATGTGNNYYKITKIQANDRGFVGQIPAGIENLTELTHFQVNNSTGLTGIIPACFASFQKLDYLNMKNCNFTGMAAPLTILPKTQLELQYNKIPFGDLLPMKSLARTAPGATAYSYDFLPQNAGLKVISNTKSVINGAQLSLDIDVLLPNHGGTTFKWYFNNAQVGTGKTYTVTMSNLTAGTYKCGITTDADMLNSATCPTSTWLTARTFVYPASAIINNTEDIIVKVTPIVTPTVGTYTYTGSAQGPNTATNTGTGSSYTFSYVGTGATSYDATATAPTNAGTFTVTATVAANGNYAQASSSATAFTINKASQTITFGALPTGKTIGEADFAPSASSATSGTNAISYSSSDAAVCSIESGNIHIVGVGTCTIYANQASNSNYNAASQVSQSITIAARPVIPLSSDATDAALNNSVADVTVSGIGTTLSIGNNKTVNNLTVNAGAKLNFTGANILYITGDLLLNANNSNSFSANIGSGTLAVTGAIKYLRTIDQSKWYFMSFPSDVTIAQITATNTALGTLGSDWYIKYYDGAKRGTLGGGANWISITEADLATYPTLHKYQGYIVGLKNAKPDTELSFPLVKADVSTEPSSRIITVAANNAGAISATNHGWNLIGQPYLSKYVGSNAIGAFNIYISDGTSTYTPYTKATVPMMNPMSAYFIQASTTLAGTGISFNAAGRQSVPSSVAIDSSDEVQLNLTSTTGTDYTLLTMDNNLSTDYEIGYDLEKWIGIGTDKPQVYSQLNGINYAFNALPMNSVNNLPIGIYTKNAGNTTISVNGTKAPSLSKLLLTDNGTSPATVTDLLAYDYSFTATAGTDNTRFVLTAQRVPTANVIETEANQPTILINNSKLMINKLSGKANVRVFDAIGRTIANKAMNNGLLEIILPVVGLYTIQIEVGGKYWTRKIVNQK